VKKTADFKKLEAVRRKKGREVPKSKKERGRKQKEHYYIGD